MTKQHTPTLVLGATGKTGRRVLARLQDAGVPTRAGSRAADPPFDWERPETWPAALEGMGAAYVSYYPDLALPGAVEAVGAFARLAVERNVRRLVLLAGRGEQEAELAEEAVRESGAELTVLRATWFAQNFSEDYMLEGVISGEFVIPAADVPEPFVDADDIADVAVAALLDDTHVGEVYELTGPRLLTFADAIAEIGAATGRDIAYVPVSMREYAHVAGEQGVPRELIELLTYLFTEVLDGRNAHMADGCSGRSAARPATSRSSRGMPRPVASGPSATAWSPDEERHDGHRLARAAAARHDIHLARSTTRDDVVLGGATVGLGLLAGLFYAYACSVMPGLRASSDRTMVEAMREINRVIQNPVFFATFLGAPALSLWALLIERRRGTPDNVKWVAAGLALARLCLVITFAVNIPLNNHLEAAGDAADITKVRDDFETPWVVWNVVRTVAVTAGFVCLTRAVFGRVRR